MTSSITLPRNASEVTVEWLTEVIKQHSFPSDAAEMIFEVIRQSLASAPQVSGELADISEAIGTVRFMDPPDGGDVSLAEQVRRMKAALDDAESRLAALSQEAGPVAHPRWYPCDECGGSGIQPAFMSRSRECSRCDGSGSIVHPSDRGGEVKG